jgi:hypothetical protein
MRYSFHDDLKNYNGIYSSKAGITVENIQHLDVFIKKIRLYD